MFPRSPRPLIAGLAAGLLASATLHAQDAPPVDTGKLLKELGSLQTQQATQATTTRTAAIQKIGATVNNPAASLEFWEEAIQATQMAGAGKEQSQFHAWKDAEGDLYKEKEVLNAIHLHLEWLLITLQRSNGVTVKDLLTPIINYTRELLADQAMMEALDDAIKKERDTAAPPGGRRGRGGKVDPAHSDDAVKKIHDMILRTPLTSSMIVQWIKLNEFVNIDGWEQSPGSFDGIYKNVIQPELRAELDPRVFDYWNAKMRKDAEQASKSKLSFEIDKYNNLRGPSLTWEMLQEYLWLGQKNRAITEMYNHIKKYPTHPDATEWVATLKGLLAPVAPTATATPSSASAAAPAFVPAPAPTTAAVPAPVAPVAPAAPLPPGVSPKTASLPGAQ